MLPPLPSNYGQITLGSSVETQQEQRPRRSTLSSTRDQLRLLGDKEPVTSDGSSTLDQLNASRQEAKTGSEGKAVVRRYNDEASRASSRELIPSNVSLSLVAHDDKVLTSQHVPHTLDGFDDLLGTEAFVSRVDSPDTPAGPIGEPTNNTEEAEELPEDATPASNSAESATIPMPVDDTTGPEVHNDHSSRESVHSCPPQVSSRTSPESESSSAEPAANDNDSEHVPSGCCVKCAGDPADTISALRWQVQGLENDIESLKEDHTAEVSELQADVRKLKDTVKANAAKKYLKDAEIRRLKRELKAKDEAKTAEVSVAQRSLEQERQKVSELEKLYRPLLMQASFKDYVNHLLRSVVANKDPTISAAFDGTVQRLRERSQSLKCQLDQVSEAYNADARAWATAKAAAVDDVERSDAFTRQVTESLDQIRAQNDELQGDMAEIFQSFMAKITMVDAEHLLTARNDQLQRQNLTLRNLIKSFMVNMKPANHSAPGLHAEAVGLRHDLQDEKDRLRHTRGERDHLGGQVQRLEWLLESRGATAAEEYQQLSIQHQHSETVVAELQQFITKSCDINPRDPGLQLFHRLETNYRNLQHRLNEIERERNVLRDRLAESQALAAEPDSHPFHYGNFAGVLDFRAFCERRGEDPSGIDGVSELVGRGPLQLFCEKFRAEMEEGGEAWDALLGLCGLGQAREDGEETEGRGREDEGEGEE